MVKASDLLSLVADDMIYVEDKMRSGIPEQHKDLQSVVDYLVGAGGKRLRPALTMMAASFYPVDSDKLYCLAAAVELLHRATLVHDDLPRKSGAVAIETQLAKSRFGERARTADDTLETHGAPVGVVACDIQRRT